VSAGALTIALTESDPAISRQTGPRAEVAFHEARVRVAIEEKDTEGERSAATVLARTLVSRGTQIDEATRLARRALLVVEDPALREELSGWFAALGEPAIAAATLRPLAGEYERTQAARLLTRIGVLLGRAGDAAGAADALFDAAREDPSDPVAPELQAGIGAWAPEAVSPERAAEGYLEGFRRREAMSDRAAAFEDLLRAFEMAPGEPLPAERLASALANRGRLGAADEVLREHARASGDRGRGVHLRRMREAAGAQDWTRAVGAGFDARLDGECEPEHVLPNDTARVRFDQLLEAVGLYELVAARLELLSEQLAGPDQAYARSSLARVYAGPLASPERALEAWAEALVADPQNEEALGALRSELAAGDPAPFVDALLRVSQSARPSARRTAFAELAEVAAQRLNDPLLAEWALESALAIEWDAQLAGLAERLEPLAREHEAGLSAAREALGRASGHEQKLEALRQLSRFLRGRPSVAEEHKRVLEQILELASDDRMALRTLERLLARHGRHMELEDVVRRLLPRTQGAERDRLRLLLSSLRRRAGDLEDALTTLVPLLEDPGAHPAAWALIVVLSARLGEETLRARALLRMSATLGPTLRSMLTAVAAESLLSAGDVEQARAAAEQASNNDPSQARPVGVLAAVSLQRSPDRSVAEALERAMGFIVPRAALCEALAVAHESLGESALALVWTQRWLSLRPGDTGAIRTLLGRVTESGDATRIGDALAWLLSQPQPLFDLAPALGAALLRLAELDPVRGAAMARRALDVLGPKAPELRETVISISDSVNEPGLAIAALERILAAGVTPEERVEVLLEIVTRRRTIGDADGAARSLARAIREGAPPRRILEELGEALPARSSDGELSLLEARAEALARLPDAGRETAARAFRELGAARWDLASDHRGAIQAWERAAMLDTERGALRFARDLVAFAGHREALVHIQSLADRQSSDSDAARVLAYAASVALSAGETEAALAIASRSLELDPSHADVLAVAERAASADDSGLLDRIYDRLATAALGCYGERAVHYRAARQFERRGEVERALGHALSAFEAVPAEGVTFVLMGRLAERAGQTSRVVRTLERVAESTKDSGMRSAWLSRAAALGGHDEESVKLRVEVLLRALSVKPDSVLVVALGGAISELARLSSDYKEIAELRFTHALEAILPRVDGPDGARVCVTLARVAAETLKSGKLALLALERALGCDADVEYFTELEKHVPLLAKERDAARTFVEHVGNAVADRYVTAGRQVLELGAQVARALDDTKRAGELLVAAAERDPDDPELARRASLAAQLSGEPALLDRIAGAVPSAERIGGLLDLATSAERGGDYGLAVEALERVDSDKAAGADEHYKARTRLRELYPRIGRHDRLEELLAAELERGGLSGTEYSRAARDLAALMATRAKTEQALDVLTDALRTLPNDAGLLEDLAGLANQAHQHRRRAAALSALADLVDGQKKIQVLRDLAPLLEEVGEDAAAATRWAELSTLQPDDVDALAALERDAEKRGDYERAASLLARRATLANRVDDVRRVRLRRATLLEERLGRADEARTELEALLAATGDHLSVLRVLADLHERLGAPLRAAPLWMRASAITTDRKEASDLAVRAAEAYLTGGEVEAARRVTEGMEAWAQSQKLSELRVDVERKGGDARALAAALEELSMDVGSDPRRHISLLMEAAKAHEAAGDLSDALAASERAAALDPSAAEPQILSRYLEYRVRGPASREHARLTVALLRGIEGPLSIEQAELRAFLVAESLDRAVGAGAGMRELSKVQTEIGARPLIALGIAERLAEAAEYSRSLQLFDVALAGDLRGVRVRGRVAITAADAARQAGDFIRALSYVELAASDAATRDAALGLQTQLRAEQRAIEQALERVVDVPAPPPPPIRRHTPAATPLAMRAVQASEPPPLPLVEPEPGPRRYVTPTAGTPVVTAAPHTQTPAMGMQPAPVPLTRVRSDAPSLPIVTAPSAEDSPSALALDEDLPGPRDSLPGMHIVDPTPPPPPPPRPEQRAPSTAPAIEKPVLESTTYSASAQPEHLGSTPARRPSSRPPPPPGHVEITHKSDAPPSGLDRFSMRPAVEVMPPSLRRMSGSFPAVSVMEVELFEQLGSGSTAAGMELIRQLENRRDRAHDLVAVCRHMVALSPGNRENLRRLYDAALADKNHSYARSVEHVLALFDPSVDPVQPPPLSDLPEDPERVRAIVFKDALGPAAEALALVWEGASHVFRREPATYGVTGMERIPAGAPTPLGRTYGAAARVLGLGRTPLFQRRGTGSVSLGVGLLTPPAVIVSGDQPRETPELSYHLGAMLTATLPEHVLVFGSTEDQARSILSALVIAFGPPGAERGSLASVGNLAEVLWERVPARNQRRLRELCEDHEGFEFSEVASNARRAARRAGLFVCGDLKVALRETCRQEGIPLESIASPPALAQAVSDYPVIADLVRLATGSEYSAARWQPARAGSRHGGAG
jgi:hypothetical protein